MAEEFESQVGEFDSQIMGIEGPKGVFRDETGNKIIKVTQEGINSLYSSPRDFWGKSKIIGKRAFAGLDFSLLQDMNFREQQAQNIWTAKTQNTFSAAELHIWTTVEEIEESAFEGCKGVNSIFIGSKKKDSEGMVHNLGVNKIGKRAFANFEGLEMIFYGDDHPEVGDEAFAGNGFKTITRLFKEKYMSSHSLMNCLSKYNGNESFMQPQMEESYIENRSILYRNNFLNAFGKEEIENLKRSVAYEKAGVPLDLIKARENRERIKPMTRDEFKAKYDYNEYERGIFKEKLKDGSYRIVKVTEEGIATLNNNPELFWDKVSEIGDEAFAGLDLTNPDKESLHLSHKEGFGWFSNISRLGKEKAPKSQLEIPAHVKKIGNRAFKDCSGVDSISVGEWWTTSQLYGQSINRDGANIIGDEAFANMDGLKIITLGSRQNLHLGERCFAGNNFRSEFSHYAMAFGGGINDVNGFSTFTMGEGPFEDKDFALKDINTNLVDNVERIVNAHNPVGNKSTGIASMFKE